MHLASHCGSVHRYTDAEGPDNERDVEGDVAVYEDRASWQPMTDTGSRCRVLTHGNVIFKSWHVEEALATALTLTVSEGMRQPGQGLTLPVSMTAR